MSNPKKSPTLHIETLNDELSVYDWQRLQMHSLNPTAAKVFELCDGQTSPAQMAKRLDAPEAVVWQSLDELGRAHLLSDVPEKPASYQNMTRQQFLKLGGAVALASIVSIVVPRPAAAQSAAAPAAAGGGATCPIVRTANVGTMTSVVTYVGFAEGPITEAQITACAPTSITYAWTGVAVSVPTAAIILSQAFGGPRAVASELFATGTTSPQTRATAALWTANRPYNGVETQCSVGGGSWDIGVLTITLA